MIRFLINRPIATTMGLVAVLILGILAAFYLPVSLMPAVKIPRITVKVEAPGLSARELETQVVKPLKNQLTQVNHLASVQSETKDGVSNLFLEFGYGSNIDLLFIEVNEKIDRVSYPEGVERPHAIKANATDIPVFYINLRLKEGESSGDGQFMELSKFVLSVISRRIEQIPEVAMVDVSGLLLPELVLVPDQDKLEALGFTLSQLENVIQRNQVDWGNLVIRDGELQYSIRFASDLMSKENLGDLYFKAADRVLQIKDVAEIREVAQERQGLVRSDGHLAVTMAIIKQSDARMEDLKKSIETLQENLRKDYPDIDFVITRDQTALLDYSIQNLKNNLLVSILLTVLVIFLFMQDFRSPFLIMLTLPLSLIVSLLFMFLLGISINIISLSGLILGVGMMVDNSIIVIDNITQHWRKGRSLKEAAAIGGGEVFAPMLSSVLTTCSIFVPLIFLSGIAGALFYDQAMAVTIGLGASLLVAVMIMPVYFCVLYKNKTAYEADSFWKRYSFSLNYVALYERGIKWVFRHQWQVWGIVGMMVAGSALLFVRLEKSKLPMVTQEDMLLYVDWNSPVHVDENDRRITELLDSLRPWMAENTVMAGMQKFILEHTRACPPSGAAVYIRAVSPQALEKMKSETNRLMRLHYPEAVFSMENSGNIFDMIFRENEPGLLARIYMEDHKAANIEKLNLLIKKLQREIPGLYIEPLTTQEVIQLRTNPELMALYEVDYSSLFHTLKSAFNENQILQFYEGQYTIPVTLGMKENSLHDLLENTSVKNAQGIGIPLFRILRENRVSDLKTIAGGEEGEYYPLALNCDSKDIPQVCEKVKEIVQADPDFDVNFGGSYFSGLEVIRELIVILGVALVLLYFILAAQFESLCQPLIILSEIVLDLFGAFFLLWICNAGLNLMSMIGIIVMCGIVINDSILKVDTINKLRKEGYGLKRSVMMAGVRRLKPIIMTSLTTILAILPFMVTGNLGNDLQYPLSVAMIGGMVVGTIVSVYFIPLAYYYIYRREV